LNKYLKKSPELSIAHNFYEQGKLILEKKNT